MAGDYYLDVLAESYQAGYERGLEMGYKTAIQRVKDEYIAHAKKIQKMSDTLEKQPKENKRKKKKKKNDNE